MVFFVFLVVFFLGGEVRCFVGPFVEVLAQIGDEHCLEFQSKVAVWHGVGGHGLRGRGTHRVEGGVNPGLQAEAVVEEEVRRTERHHVSGSGFVVVHGDVGRAKQLHLHKVTAHGFSELLDVVRGDHDGAKTVVVVSVAEAAGQT